jgi:hypothetical protein
VSDWRDRMAAIERDRENLRAQRMRALDEALTAVRVDERDVLSADDVDVLAAAARVVASLRQVW